MLIGASLNQWIIRISLNPVQQWQNRIKWMLIGASLNQWLSRIKFDTSNCYRHIIIVIWTISLVLWIWIFANKRFSILFYSTILAGQVQSRDRMIKIKKPSFPNWPRLLKLAPPSQTGSSFQNWPLLFILFLLKSTRLGSLDVLVYNWLGLFLLNNNFTVIFHFILLHCSRFLF